MISTVTGSFDRFNVQLSTEDEDFSTADITFTAEAASVNTGSEQRDGHLKGADFFDAEQFPELTFKATSFKGSGDDYQLSGDLTIKGVTKPVTVAVEFGGIGKDPWGNTKAGFTISGKINRADWGLTWNAALETGGLLVSDEIRVLGELQFSKQ